MYIALIITLWFLSGVPGYFYQRSIYRRHQLKWTRGDRAFAIIFSACLGLAAGLAGIGLWMARGIDWDAEAKW